MNIKAEMMEKIKELPGLKRDELGKCCLCGKGVCHNRDLQFYRLSLESFILNPNAIQRRSGMEQFFGGGPSGAALAGVMGPDEDIGTQMFVEEKMIVCSPCVMGREPIVRLLTYIECKSESEDEKNELD